MTAAAVIFASAAFLPALSTAILLFLLDAQYTDLISCCFATAAASFLQV
jgi:hypothetical protein